MIFNLQMGRAQPLGSRQILRRACVAHSEDSVLQISRAGRDASVCPIRDTGHVSGRTPLRSGEPVRSSPRQHACSRQAKLA